MKTFLILIFSTFGHGPIEFGTYKGELLLLRHAHQVELEIKQDGTYISKEILTSLNSWTEKGKWQINQDSLILTPEVYKPKRIGKKVNCNKSSNRDNSTCNSDVYFISEGKLFFTKKDGKYENELILQ